MKRLMVTAIGLAIVLGSTGCIGRPAGASGPANAPARGAPAQTTESTSAPAQQTTQSSSASESSSAHQTSSTQETTSSQESATLSESAYKDSVTPIMRRLRENGLSSLNPSSPISSCSGVSEPRNRMVRLREELNDIERDLNELSNPSGFQRAQDDLGRAVRAQKEAHDLQIEALDNCSNRSTLTDRLQRAQNRLLDARNAWEDSRRALNVNP